MSKMVQRLGRLLCCPREGGCQLPAGCASHYHEAHARLFIAAMREPTDGMVAAGGELLLDGSLTIAQTAQNARGVWRAMIDAALK